MPLPSTFGAALAAHVRLPSAQITDDYERGSYVYFDYNINRDDSAEGGWCYRVKQDFKIEYSALENQL